MTKRVMCVLFVLFCLLVLLLPACQRGTASAPVGAIVVELSFSEAPVLGKPVQLTAAFQLREPRPFDAPNTTARIILPEGFELVRGDLQWQGDVLRGKKYQITATVKSVKTGDWEIKATAFYYPNRTDVSGGSRQIYALVRGDGATVSDRLPGLGGIPVEDLRDPKNPKRYVIPYDRLPPEYRPSSWVKPASATTFEHPLRVYGEFKCQIGQLAAPEQDEPAGIVKGQVNILNEFGGLIAACLTGEGDQAGMFSITIENRYPGYIYVEIVTNSDIARVRDGLTPYTKWYPFDCPPPQGSTEVPLYTGVNFPSSESTNHKAAWRIYESIVNDKYNRGAHYFLTESPRGPQWQGMWKADVLYPGNYGNWYDWVQKIINIVGEDSTKGLDTVQHEYGHAVLHCRWGTYLQLPQSHEIPLKMGSTGNAFKEGWCDFFPLVVQNDFVYHVGNGVRYDLEAATWDEQDWQNGDLVEGRVAGALWDIYDSAGDGQDAYSGGFANIWQVTTDVGTSGDVRYFWKNWQDAGFSVGARGPFHQNTIAYRVSANLQGGMRPTSGYYVPLSFKAYTEPVTTENIFTLVPVPGDSFTVNDGPTGINIRQVPPLSGGARAIKFTFLPAYQWGGAYYVTLGSPHTLINTLSGTVDFTGDVGREWGMGTLLEGNADDGVQVYGEDFSMLLNDYLQVPGGSKWNNGRCDFDRDGQVRITDFTLLAMNYNLTSPRTVGGAGLGGVKTYGTVNLSLNTTAQTIRVGDRFYVTIDVAAGSESLTGVDAFANFAPAYLRVVSLTAGDTLPSTFRRAFNNAAGTLDLCMGSNESPVSGAFTLGTIRFEATAATGGTDITFNLQQPRQTVVAYEGNSLLGTATNLTVAIQP
ncbi:MAG: cohesin domain-containing protein [Chloroflexota bacterium]